MWPPPNVPTTFKALKEKLEKLRSEGKSVAEQVAVVDWWIGKLHELRSRLGGVGRI